MKGFLSSQIVPPLPEGIVAGLPQADYRSDPNAEGSIDPEPQSPGDWQNPNPMISGIAPWSDQTWKSFDALADALRFNDLNDPEGQACLLGAPEGSAQGWSPDAERTLAARSGFDGSPPR
ncbi:MAG: hypothetical protein ACRDFX_12455 [Chloroflexota bacterium]